MKRGLTLKDVLDEAADTGTLDEMAASTHYPEYVFRCGVSEKDPMPYSDYRIWESCVVAYRRRTT